MSIEAIRELGTLASVCPELNMANYTEDDVRHLNDWAIEMSLLVEKFAAIQQAEAQQPSSKEHLFELWWEAHMPNATQEQAWTAFTAAVASNGVGIAAQQPVTGEPVVSRNPFASRCYTMSESHLSGHRLIVGFEKLGDAQDAHEWVARQGRGRDLDSNIDAAMLAAKKPSA